MRFAMCVLLGILLLGSFAPMQAADPAGAGQVAFAFTGGSVWTSASTGICKWYLPLVRGLNVPADPTKPISANAYFVWVSDFATQSLPANGPLTLVMAPAGTANIYFNANPTDDYWKNPSAYGPPVATFTRNAAVLYSADPKLASDTFTFSASLVSSKTFMVNGRPFNFRDLIPHGMTCFEAGTWDANTGYPSAYEVGSCIANGGGQ